MLQIDTPCQKFLATPLAKGQHSKEIRWWHLKMRDLVLKYNRILGLIFNETAQITAKTLTSSQLSVCDMLTHVNFPTFTMVEHRS